VPNLNSNNDIISAEDVDYDVSYYENYNGSAYGRTSEWLGFFDKISENIIETLGPKSVLDVGCAYGLLVETLRDRGIEAFGMDVSEYAISQARSDINDYLAVESILTPLKNQYDLIVSIEVIEHIEEKNCDRVVENMCLAANKVLLATTPDDFDDPTHFNVKPPIYWIEKFSQYGFQPDITYDAGFLTPYAILFRKNNEKLDTQIQKLFGEKKLQDLYFARLNHESNLQKIDIDKFERHIKESEIEIKSLTAVIKDSQTHIENLQASLTIETTARDYYQTKTNLIESSWYWKLLTPYRVLGRVARSCMPVLPRSVGISINGKTVECESSFFRGWGLVVVHLETEENTVLRLTANTSDKAERVVSLPLIQKGKKRVWVFRNKTEYKKYSADISYGELDNIQFMKISTLFAVLSLIWCRWEMGQGLKPGINLFFRCVKHLVNWAPRKIVDEIWPKIEDKDVTYEDWLNRFDQFAFSQEIGGWLAKLNYQPMISIILPTFNSDVHLLSMAIKSVEAQSYANWQLCIADDGSTSEKLKNYLKQLEINKKIIIEFRPKNGHIAAASNSAIGLATGEFLAFLDHDDELHPHALACIAGKLNKDRNLDLIYTDEDKIDRWGNRSEPNFKSDWNPDLLLSQNYICHLAVYRRELVRELGGIREGFEGAQDYDLLLRFTEKTQRISHVPLVLYHWRAVEGSTALSGKEKDYAHAKAKLALKESLERRSVDAQVMPSGLGVYHRIKYEIPPEQPLVSIIIPTRDYIELVKVCVDGIVNKTNYKNWEILIVDNGSEKKESHNYFENIESQQIRVLKFPGKFNYSAINNYGVTNANGSVVLLLNNDIEVIDPDWLTELVSHALRPDIGAVGARLYYSDDHVQHDGIIVGIGGVAGYANPRLRRIDAASFGGSRIIRNFSAVTAAALAIRKDVFNEVRGLDQTNLAVAFNDVDFCLRVAEAGYRNLYTPYCELYHHESLSRGLDTKGEKAERFKKEVHYMQRTWPKTIANDPYYNPNLSLRHGYSIDINRGLRWPWVENDQS
jgi:O-antigen biosynthesis protein